MLFLQYHEFLLKEAVFSSPGRMSNHLSFSIFFFWCVCFTYFHVNGYMCLDVYSHVCSHMWRHEVNVGSPPPPAFFHLIDWAKVSQVTDMANLFRQLSLGISWLHLQRLEFQASCHSHKALIWFLEVLALFLKLAQTVTIEHLPRLPCINWWKCFTSPSFWVKAI